jgi:uncharacterized membrane protein YccF (DUF307 family)
VNVLAADRVPSCADEGGRPLEAEARAVRVLGNVLWLLLAGFWLAIGYLVAALICFVLIITIPFGIASWRMAGYALWPFGRVVVADPGAGAGSLIGNVLWFLLAGLWLALAHVVTGLLLFLTIIGIPFGVASFKMAALAVAPLGKRVVPLEAAVGYEHTVVGAPQYGR